MARRPVTYERTSDLLNTIRREGALPEDVRLTRDQIKYFRQNPEAFMELPREARFSLEQRLEPTTREKWLGGGERRRIEQPPLSEYQQGLQKQIQQQMISSLLPQFLQQLSPEYQQQQQALQARQFMESPYSQQLMNPMGMPLFPDQEQQMQQPGLNLGGISSLLAPFAGQFAQSDTGQRLRGYIENKAQGLGQGLMKLLGRG